MKLKGDQTVGMARDSEIKFECRLLISAIAGFGLPPAQAEVLLEPVRRIVRIENNRLNRIKAMELSGE